MYKQIRNKRIIISPLSWGLGHATRIIPIIKELQKNSNELYVCSSSYILKFFKNELLDSRITYINKPSYKVHFSSKSPFFSTVVQLPVLFITVLFERIFAHIYNQKLKPDLFISDSLFGFRTRRCKSIIISHQTRLITPFKSKYIDLFAQKVNFLLLKNFEEVWIPDFEGNPNLSGKLSHNDTKLNKKYIGLLSRFNLSKTSHKKEGYLIILSGPEPSRSIFENQLLKEIEKSSYFFTMVRGSSKEFKKKKIIPSNLTIIDLANSKDLEKLMLSHKLIIARSGYSTIMDIYSLNLRALLIPTTGQSEQEYLANKLMEEGKYYSVSEKELNLDKAIKRAIQFREQELN